MPTPRRDWAALILLRTLTPRENVPLADMLARFESPEAALRAPPSVWRETCGFDPDPDRLGAAAAERASEMAVELEAMGGVLLDIRQPDYPAALRRLPQPPVLLFIRGRRELLGRPAIAVVGTRRHSTYGRDATVSLVVGLVRAGYVIVSGLARGIDSVAHRTALDVGGDTVGVLGTGLDVAYPPEHQDLASNMAERGCLVSEFPPGTPPRKYHFPQRNRVIAGLARAVLIIEAGERSGALITAQYALEEGKEVFAVPGPIHNATSLGTNRLIQDGAGLVTSVADILSSLEARSGEPLPEPVAAGLDAGELANHVARQPEPAASVLARRVWAALGSEARELESLTADLGADPAAMAAALLELELSGLVEKLPGPRYARAAPRSSGPGRVPPGSPRTV